MENPHALITDIITLGLAHEVQSPGLMQRAHRHNEVEVNFTEAGAMTYLYGSTRVCIAQGQLALFWATIPHQVVSVEPATVAHWLTIPFDTFLQWQLAESLTQQIIRGRFVSCTSHMPFQLTHALFQQWHTDLQQRDVEHYKIVLLEIEAYLRRLVLHTPNLLETGPLQSKTALETLNKVEHMACYIADHYPEIQHIEEVAQEVHLHPNYAMSLFRKQFGVSIGEYITQYRIAHAQRLLITTSATTSSIALEAGFGSVSRFYTAFKNACKQSPGEYRSNLRPSIQQEKKN